MLVELQFLCKFHVFIFYNYTRQMDNKFNEKSYNKAKTVRKLFRNEMFQRSRQMNFINSNYLSHYDEQTQHRIRISLEGPIPEKLPLFADVTVDNISYFRRSRKPIFKTRMGVEEGHDPHMTFESLWYLAGIDDIENYPNSQKVIKQFQQNLSSYLTMPFNQIKQMAIIASGNKILGKEENILQIVNQDENQLWVLINHIYQRKINFTTMYNYLNRNLPIIYRTIYQMSNNQKDEIIQSIVKNQPILEFLLMAMNANNVHPEIPLYCVRIFGNILAERDDYSEVFMKHQLLDRLYPLIKVSKAEMKKDILWLLSNYISDSGSANDLLCKTNFLEKILMMYKNQTTLTQKLQLYYILINLAQHGEQLKILHMAVEQKILEQCGYDIQYQDRSLTLSILTLILKLVKIAELYLDEESKELGERNPFIIYIKNSTLQKCINANTYHGDQDISDTSLDILHYLEEDKQKFQDQGAM